MSLEIVVALILAASTKSEGSSELSVLIWFVAVVIVISIIIVSRISSTTKDLDKLTYKSVDLERARKGVFGASAKPQWEVDGAGSIEVDCS